MNFPTVIRPPFVTVAQTGSIGEAFVQLEPCAVNDDCLILLPKSKMEISVSKLVIAAAYVHLERWRFSYGRKLTPSRIMHFSIHNSPKLEIWVKDRIDRIFKIIKETLAAYGDKRGIISW